MCVLARTCADQPALVENEDDPIRPTENGLLKSLAWQRWKRFSLNTKELVWIWKP
jgi:hypothetical protein